MVFGRRYRVTEKIGAGGMADVYKAVDETLGRTVAVKVLNPRYAQAADFIDRFRREAQAAANLSHPGIGNVYDSGSEGDTYYIVMEYVSGIDLKALVKRDGPLDPVKAANYAEQVCAALAAAHGYDVIHRDIKPQNILLQPDGRVRVMDFGIARVTDGDDLTHTGSVLGTAQYVSPEQAQGRPLTPGSDLYSLGCVLYEMLTGRPPFDGDSPVAIALKQVNERPVPPGQIDPRVPRPLEAIVMRALEKDPSRRYTSADEMRRELKLFAESGAVAAEAAPMGDTSVMPVVKRSGGAPRPAPHAPPRRRRPLWPLLVSISVVVAVGLAVAWALGLFGGSVEVPDVRGMTLEEASNTIIGTGLLVGDVTEVYSSDVPEGKVIEQSPAAAERVEMNWPVTLVISRGEESVLVPDVTGMSESEAFSTLRKAGLYIDGVRREYSRTIAKGLAITTEPTAGISVAKGGNIILVVSDGIETKALPSVVGKSQKDAKAELEAAGFKVKQVDEYSDKVKKGFVISQDPDGGLISQTGSTVTIHVSKGPESVEIPDVTTLSEAEATAKLEALGFAVLVNQIPSADVGKVVTQDPAGGSIGKLGDTITIWVGVASP
ncbi:MAG: serine/threonine protein kinase [Coriobacteriaceae bacterium]|nr:serine/threonine protein kinase [Coriobacteriaceae bacterium]